MSIQTIRSGSRVRKALDIRTVFDCGRSSAAGPVVVYAVRTQADAPPRYGLVVGRKFGGAVVRNRIRRLLREAFRRQRQNLPPGHDFLLLPRGQVETLRAGEAARFLGRAARGALRRLAEEGPRATEPAPRRRKRKKKRTPAT